MIEFLNYVPPEGSIGELLMRLLSASFILFVIWLSIREVKRDIK